MGFSIGSALGSVGKSLAGGALGGLAKGPVGGLLGGALKGLTGGAQQGGKGAKGSKAAKGGKASKGQKAKSKQHRGAPAAQAKSSNPIQASWHRDSFQPAAVKPAGATPALRPAAAKPANHVQSWIAQAQAELRKLGIQDSQMNQRDLETLIQKESSGNPNAVNDWDSNAKRGTPSIGLMQTIQPTFDRYKAPGHGNIRNPVDNIIAGVRYSVDRYGSVSNVPGIRSMRSGGAYQGY